METRICMENVWAKYGCFNESKIDEGRQKQAGMCECALFLWIIKWLHFPSECCMVRQD